MEHKFLNSAEIKKIELDLLLKFDEICKENNLTYWLCGGTLLGAIRHKGFIPWDDDIDVLMPRNDFDKLLELEEKQDKNNVEQIVSWKSGKSIYPFFKLINTNTVVKERYLSDKYTTGIWIDIFPTDGMPDDDKLIARKFKQIKFWKTILLTAYSELGTGASWYAILAKRILVPICQRLNTKKICDKINAISSEFPIDTSPYVGGFLWGYGPQEKMPKDFLETVYVEFEGHSFPAPKRWDYYLTQLYGDYMQLPPENKRIFHGFQAWYKE